MKRIFFCLLLSLLAVSGIRAADPEPHWLDEEMKKIPPESHPREPLLWIYERGQELECAGETDKAWDCYLLYVIWLRENAMYETILYPDFERTDYWLETTGRLNNIKRFSVERRNEIPHISRLVLDCEILSKGLMLNSTINVRRRIIENDHELAEDWDNMCRQHEILEIAAANLKQVEPEFERKRAENSLSDSISMREIAEFDRAKRMLTETFGGIREAISGIASAVFMDCPDIQADFNVKMDDVWAAMSDREALVEYFTYTDARGNTIYAAAVDHNAMDYPHIHVIGREDVFSQYLAGEIDYQNLYRCLWSPLTGLLRNADVVYIVPAGMLHTVPFGGLHDGDDYICDKYEIRQLLSAKTIAGKKSTRLGVERNIVLTGGADFDFSPERSESLSVVPPQDSTNLECGKLLRSVRGQGFDYLPGSLAEVRAIARLLESDDWDIRLLSDTDANKSDLVSILSANSPEILHISTHGFWIPEAVGDGDPNRNIFRISDNSLMRSGLALSGANQLWNEHADPFIDDNGILTALEISRIDLSKTGLTVLSACETGLGEIHSSEGVYGLVRGFRLAGCRSVLVSLWDVSDTETTEFMTVFYHHLFSEKDPVRALKLTRCEFRIKKPDNPSHWAGFVLVE